MTEHCVDVLSDGITTRAMKGASQMSVCDIGFDQGRESLMECLNVIYIIFL